MHHWHAGGMLDRPSPRHTPALRVWRSTLVKDARKGKHVALSSPTLPFLQCLLQVAHCPPTSCSCFHPSPSPIGSNQAVLPMLYKLAAFVLLHGWLLQAPWQMTMQALQARTPHATRAARPGARTTTRRLEFWAASTTSDARSWWRPAAARCSRAGEHRF